MRGFLCEACRAARADPAVDLVSTFAGPSRLRQLPRVSIGSQQVKRSFQIGPAILADVRAKRLQASGGGVGPPPVHPHLRPSPDSRRARACTCRPPFVRPCRPYFYSPTHAQIHASCLLLGDGGQRDRLHWPLNCTIQIWAVGRDGSQARPQTYRPYGRPYSTKLADHSRDLPADISDLVGQGSNTIQVDCVDDERRFCLLVRAVRLRSASDVAASAGGWRVGGPTGPVVGGGLAGLPRYGPPAPREPPANGADPVAARPTGPALASAAAPVPVGVWPHAEGSPFRESLEEATRRVAARAAQLLGLRGEPPLGWYVGPGCHSVRAGAGTRGADADSDSDDIELGGGRWAARRDLVDPLTQARLSRPGVARRCVAGVPFDLEMWAEQASRTRKWVCPHCSCPAPLEEVWPCAWTAAVLASTSDDVTEVDVDEWGRWRLPTGPEGRPWRTPGAAHEPGGPIGVGPVAAPAPLPAVSPVKADADGTAGPSAGRKRERDQDANEGSDASGCAKRQRVGLGSGRAAAEAGEAVGAVPVDRAAVAANKLAPPIIDMTFTSDDEAEAAVPPPPPPQPPAPALPRPPPSVTPPSVPDPELERAPIVRAAATPPPATEGAAQATPPATEPPTFVSATVVVARGDAAASHPPLSVRAGAGGLRLPGQPGGGGVGVGSIAPLFGPPAHGAAEGARPATAASATGDSRAGPVVPPAAAAQAAPRTTPLCPPRRDNLQSVLEVSTAPGLEEALRTPNVVGVRLICTLRLPTSLCPVVCARPSGSRPIALTMAPGAELIAAEGAPACVVAWGRHTRLEMSHCRVAGAGVHAEAGASVMLRLSVVRDVPRPVRVRGTDWARGPDFAEMTDLTRGDPINAGARDAAGRTRGQAGIGADGVGSCVIADCVEVSAVRLGYGLMASRGGRVEALACAVHAPGLSGVRAAGAGSEALVRRCLLSECGGHGVEVTGGAQATASDAVAIVRPIRCGIFAGGAGSRATVGVATTGPKPHPAGDLPRALVEHETNVGGGPARDRDLVRLDRVEGAGVAAVDGGRVDLGARCSVSSPGTFAADARGQSSVIHIDPAATLVAGPRGLLNKQSGAVCIIAVGPAPP